MKIAKTPIIIEQNIPGAHCRTLQQIAISGAAEPFLSPARLAHSNSKRWSWVQAMARKPKQIQGVYEKVPGSDVWYIRYRTPDGVQIRKRIGSRQAAIKALEKVHSVASAGSGYVARSARQATLDAVELSSVESSIPLSRLIDDYLAFMSDPSNPDAPIDTVNPRQRLTAMSRALGSRPAASIKPYD